MTYKSQFQMTEDQVLRQRVAACVATENAARGLGIKNPLAWATDRVWVFAVIPAWVSVYETDGESAITDAMILEAVTSLLTEGGA